MASKWVIHAKSAMEPSQKRQILSIDLCRGLLICDPRKWENLAIEVMKKYNTKLRLSGHSLEEIQRITDSGITSYEEKLDSLGTDNL